MTFTADELALLKRALTIPTCWNPRVREEALRLVERGLVRQPLFEEAAS